MAAPFTLTEAARRVGGSVQGDGSVAPPGLSIDTRTIRPGECFVALRAERDGHDFAATSVEKGASCLLVDHVLPLAVPQVIVPDTLSAMQAWGAARLAELRPRAVFGVTGSVGKTSTKELLAGATGGWKTPGNRNNTLGLPQALAAYPGGFEAVVLEMGMSTPGEIHRLTELAPPDFGVITNIGTAHLENFAEGQQGIARAKGELVAGLRPGGAWVFHAEDAWCRWIAEQPWVSHTRAVAVGDGEPYGIEAVQSLGPRGERFSLRTPEGPLGIELQLRGRHQVGNAALAAVVALLGGFDRGAVVSGLGAVAPEPGRGRLHALKGGGWLLDETYNASPDSIQACAEALLELEGDEPMAVLGSMRELGANAPAIHRATGAALKKLGLSRLWAFGEFAADYATGFGPGAAAFADFEPLRNDPRGLGAIPQGARILVKGSRFWRSERVVEWLLLNTGVD
ncbi:MAG TPA: UDP-N-acetylmuramoyl-tripeptide--D-alanyl-D-alanine ligase [Holophagaceae bacterium]|nr:UDP-N-acetylmuramoyl-tripeptide--D-alanyl-D-alanine ligase [Holophagaceae bacterium]